MGGGQSVAGMYGLRFSGLPEAPGLLSSAPHDWPLVRYQYGPTAPAPLREGRIWSVDDAHGEVRLYDGGRLSLSRGEMTIEHVGPAVDAGMLGHPTLAVAVVLISRWLGREAFHGGAFVAGGRAYAVLGEGAAGKSTLLAALAARGVPVVTEDLLIVDGTSVFSGPRAIDLRAAPRAELRGPLRVGPARGGTRWRLALPGIEGRQELGGWFFLGATDTDRVETEALSLKERLTRLARLRAAHHLPSDPVAMLDLAALPAWELRRPLSWSALEATVELVLGLAAEASEAR